MSVVVLGGLIYVNVNASFKNIAAHKVSVVSKKIVSVTTKPVVEVSTTKSVAPSATTTAKPVAVPTVGHTSTSRTAPVVVPSPSSNVSSLVPTVSPTSTAPAVTTPSTATSTGSSTPSTAPSAPATTSSYSSSNWSGYLSTTSGNYTQVSASWVAPTVSGNGTTTSADATWIGIGGVTTSDLIQIGTDNTVSASGQVSTEAFFELLPAYSQTVPNITVSPGDSITASIVEISSGQWTATITDTTNGQSYSYNVSYSSTNSSVEWIEEDPSYSSNRLIPLDNFGTARFTNGATVSNGVSETIAGSDAQSITMLDRNYQIEALPSAIANNGTDFSVAWQ